MKRTLLVIALAALFPLSLLLLFSSKPAVTPVAAAPQAPAIVLTYTVGTDPAVCATTRAITLPVGGGTVIPCYTVRNVGDVPLTRHDLQDDYLGPILTTFNYGLVPGASVFLTQSLSITQSHTSSATWTAYNPGPVDLVTASDAITVHVPPRQPAIILELTAGTSPAACATSDILTLSEPAEVYFCYTVRNSGNISLTRHTLSDNHLGPILSDFPYILVPGASAFLTQSTFISQTQIGRAIWTAYNPGPSDSVDAAGSAKVIIGYELHLPFWRD